ncbi:MAG TPA: response regulator [Leptolyngbyaceae cyanobacterium M33_DOE_097]|uniref:Response regulator n=1 Tax=Oscillatoriales cyanobacterium SpSt-418 TaxID=2282169 RepID=A0A7C3PKH6_9CYAN|nr:response regulator [Leptolyngbyaceae cyanobacterium M33_DOE_097]
MRVLVIEDDEYIAQALALILTSQNYAVEVATDGESGWELIQAFDYDLVLLDVMLPKLDGISLCRQIRAEGLQMPILLVTGCDSGHDKAIGLDAGADDYVVKPFDTEELVARVRALLRRGSAIAQPVLEWGDLRLDPSSKEVTYGTTPLALTPKEYALLELFLRNRRRVFSCGMILEHLWAFEEMPGEEAVRTHIKGLRQKLKAVGLPGDVVETVYGIGYRLKPRELGETAKSKPKNAKSASAASQADLSTQLPALVGVDQLWHRFKDRFKAQVDQLEQAITALAQVQSSSDLQQQAMLVAHSLVGALGTFGIPEGTHLARQIERLLQVQHSFSPAQIANLQEWVSLLRQQVEHSHHEHFEALTNIGIESVPLSVSADQHCPLLLIGDRALAQTLLVESANWGFRTDFASSLAEVREKIALASPDVLLLDLAISDVPYAGLALLMDLKQQVPPIPVGLVTEQNDLAERLELARLGVRAFVQKSATPAQIMQVVNQLLQQAEQTRAKVMVVDDDLALLVRVRSLLEPWGLKITTLTNPEQFYEVLEAASPDLLILDVEMPQISGIDLCQIVRNDSRWSGLPILFLTAHTDAETINQVFSVGADDFVSKPIIGPELITRIINRLERIRFLRQKAEIDPLTQVATRQKSTQDLNIYLRLAKRQNQPFCLAIVEITPLVEDACDRPTQQSEEDLLRQTGQTLRQAIRAEDVVGRWGKAEFVIGLYGTTKQHAMQRLDDVLKKLAQQPLLASNNGQATLEPIALSQVQFHLGVAQYPQDGVDLPSLYHAANLVLMQQRLELTPLI